MVVSTRFVGSKRIKSKPWKLLECKGSKERKGKLHQWSALAGFAASQGNLEIKGSFLWEIRLIFYHGKRESIYIFFLFLVDSF